MTWTPEMITAVATAIVTVLGGFAVVLRELRSNTRTTNHTARMINSKADEESLWRQTMIDALTQHGITVPIDPGIAAAAIRMHAARQAAAAAGEDTEEVKPA